MRRRIVIDATPLLYWQSGIGRSARMLIRAIASLECRHEIVLFGRRLMGRALRDDGFAYATRQLRLPRASEWLIKRARLVDLLCRGDLYHATDFYMPLGAVEKAVATIHDIIFLAQREKMVDHERLARWVPEFARRCRRIIAVSEFSRKDIINHLDVSPGKIDVVYPGVDRATFHPSSDPSAVRERLKRELGLRRPYFLAVSCSTGRKNTPFLLEAYATLLKNDPQNDLVLAWSPPADIRHKYSGGASARIHFIGRQGDEALAELYRGATALVFPSLYEGFGLPILEAMSCGTPVISSHSSSLPEVGGEAAMYVDPKEQAALVRALESFENEPSLRRTFATRAIARASLFSWERSARETLAIYDRCLEAA